MKQILIILHITFCCTATFAQSFEGKIVYQNSVKSKIPNLSDEKLSAMMGSTQIYYLKGGDYKSEFNGTFISWQMYINSDNKLYNKFSSSDDILWNDVSVNPDSVLNSEIHKDAAEVLGYKCDELILTCKSGVQKYYFTSKLPIDSKLYAKHLFGNWYAYLSKSNAVPLKMVVDNAQFSIESIATDIKPMKLYQALFTLPTGAKTAKSPY